MIRICPAQLNAAFSVKAKPQTVSLILNELALCDGFPGGVDEAIAFFDSGGTATSRRGEGILFMRSILSLYLMSEGDPMVSLEFGRDVPLSMVHGLRRPLMSGIAGRPQSVMIPEEQAAAINRAPLIYFGHRSKNDWGEASPKEAAFGEIYRAGGELVGATYREQRIDRYQKGPERSGWLTGRIPASEQWVQE